MVHCPCSAIFNLLLHPCRHNLLRPPRVSRQKLHYSRLHSLTHRHSWFLPHLLLQTSHPHNLTSRTACPCLVPIYCPSISHPHPPHTNPPPPPPFGPLRDIEAYLFAMAQNDDDTAWHGQKKSRYLSSEGPSHQFRSTCIICIAPANCRL